MRSCLRTRKENNQQHCTSKLKWLSYLHLVKPNVMISPGLSVLPQMGVGADADGAGEALTPRISVTLSSASLRSQCMVYLILSLVLGDKEDLLSDNAFWKHFALTSVATYGCQKRKWSQLLNSGSLFRPVSRPESGVRAWRSLTLEVASCLPHFCKQRLSSTFIYWDSPTINMGCNKHVLGWW